MIPSPIELITATGCIDLVYPNNIESGPTVSFSSGPVSVGDSSEGIMDYTWIGYVDSQSGDIHIGRLDDQSTDEVVLTGIYPTVLSITFDQSGRYTIAHQVGTSSFLYFYDTDNSMYETIEVANSHHPLVDLDDKRTLSNQSNDIIFAYQIDNPDGTTSINYRVQRNRYTDPYVLADNIEEGKFLTAMGMNSDYRLVVVCIEPNPRFTI